MVIDVATFLPLLLQVSDVVLQIFPIASICIAGRLAQARVPLRPLAHKNVQR